MPGIRSIIVLSSILACGFLLVILSCALYDRYHPLAVVATFALAPVPNWICGRCANPDDFMETSGSAIVDFGRWLTGFMVVMGIALPIIFNNSGIINTQAMVMSIIGGLLIYGTVVSFTMFFAQTEEDF